MLKDILLNTAEILNRDDLIEALNSQSQTILPQAIQNDILRLISYYNYTIETISENYFNIVHSQSIISDKNRKINFLSFTYEPAKITSVTKENFPVLFTEYSSYILVPEPNTLYKIDYRYIPERINNLNDDTKLPKCISSKIVCYGIASEFFASKNQFEQAEYWKNKFIFEIFKAKTNKDRRIKRTFVI